MWKKGSLSQRFIVIYFLLVFIALIIVGVFIIQQLEFYNMQNTRASLTKVAEEGVLKSLSGFESLSDSQAEIQANIDTWYTAVQEEFFVIDETYTIIASSNQSLIGFSAVESLDEGLITQALLGEVAEGDSVIGEQEIQVKSMAFPVKNEDRVTGVLYMRKDLTEVYETLKQAISIFLRGMLVALAVTIVLGILISRSITRPINELTYSAEAVAKGDFERRTNVQSEDEIGRLAKAFNKMADQLGKNLTEISGEKNKLEIVLKTMADGLIAADDLGRIVHINKAALEMLGVTEGYARSRSYDELIGKYCPELTMSAIKMRILKGEEGDPEEIFEIEGSVFYSRYEVIKTDVDTEVSIVLNIQDITERQKLESMQKDFVANVSHELNTPLTTIKSYTETMLDSEGLLEQEEMVKKFLGVIDSEADRMSRIVKDLLQLSKLDYRKEALNKQVIDLVRLVDGVVTKNSINAGNKNQQLNKLFDERKQIFANVDEDKMEQVLLNILSNAIKYTEENGRIDVDVLTRGDFVYVSVKDNGIGIAEKELPRLFERFYRVDKARSRAMGSGTGLGLSIAKEIVEEHEGSIEIESKEGRGTTVTIKVPVVK